jgi:hypothetical protein
MDIVAGATRAEPTNLAPLARLLAYAQGLGLERYLGRPKRGVGTLALSLLWLYLAWRGSGRPHHLSQVAEPLLPALLGCPAVPTPRTLYRSLAYFPAKAVREAVEAAYRAELPRRSGRVWVAIDAHQLPYWGRGRKERFQKGWSGSHGRRLRGYRLYLAVDTDTGQIITYLLARGGLTDAQVLVVLARRVRQILGRRLAGVVADCGFTSRGSVAALSATGIPFILGFARSRPLQARLASLSGQQRRWLRDGGAIRLGECPWDPRLRLFAIGARSPDDRRGPWVYVTSLRSVGPQRLARLYRQRWRVEQVIDELVNGHDLDHLVASRLHPNQVAVGFRLLARNLAIGLQIADAQARPPVIREPRAFRAAHVEGLGLVTRDAGTFTVAPIRPTTPSICHLPWAHLTIRVAA